MKRTPCDYCDRKFVDHESLIKHQRSMHRKAVARVSTLVLALTPFARFAQEMDDRFTFTDDYLVASNAGGHITLGQCRKAAEILSGPKKR